MKSTILNIKESGPQIFTGPTNPITKEKELIVGNIKKIFILTDKPMHHVNLTFKTNEGEILFKTNIEQPMTVLYSWNFIDSQGRGCEYYSQGDIFLEVEDLIDGEEIKQVTIFYS